MASLSLNNVASSQYTALTGKKQKQPLDLVLQAQLPDAIRAGEREAEQAQEQEWQDVQVAEAGKGRALSESLQEARITAETSMQRESLAEAARQHSQNLAMTKESLEEGKKQNVMGSVISGGGALISGASLAQKLGLWGGKKAVEEATYKAFGHVAGEAASEAAGESLATVAAEKAAETAGTEAAAAGTTGLASQGLQAAMPIVAAGLSAKLGHEVGESHGPLAGAAAGGLSAVPAVLMLGPQFWPIAAFAAIAGFGGGLMGKKKPATPRVQALMQYQQEFRSRVERGEITSAEEAAKITPSDIFAPDKAAMVTRRMEEKGWGDPARAQVGWFQSASARQARPAWTHGPYN